MSTQMFEYLHAFKLLCITENLDWTWNVFVQKIILKSIEELDQSIQSRSLSVESNAKSIKLLGFYLMVQAHVVSHLCNKNDSNIYSSETIKTLIQYLQSNFNSKGNQKTTVF